MSTACGDHGGKKTEGKAEEGGIGKEEGGSGDKNERDIETGDREGE